MAYEPVIENAERINGKLTLNGTVKRGNTLAYNGTGWVQADASDATTNLYAQYIAMESGESSTIIPGCKSCVLYDEDAPYTANATQYVSATAGLLLLPDHLPMAMSSKWWGELPVLKELK